MLHSLPGPSIYFYRYFANGGGCIKLYSIYRAMNWSTAHQTCEDIGGRLPEMNELKDDSVLYNTNVSWVLLQNLSQLHQPISESLPNAIKIRFTINLSFLMLVSWDHINKNYVKIKSLNTGFKEESFSIDHCIFLWLLHQLPAHHPMRGWVSH